MGVRAALSSAWRFLTASPVRLALIGAAFAGGVVAGAPVQRAVFHYQWVDPAFCDDCHAHDYANEAWASSLHADLTTCHDCHKVPIRHYPHNLWMMITDRPETAEDIKRPDIPMVVCEQCHTASGAEEPLSGPMPDALRDNVVKVDNSPLHRAHLDSETRNPGTWRGGEAGSDVDEAGEITCMDCHGQDNNRAHQFLATQENCVTCHEGQAHRSEGMASLECRDCHFGGFVGTTDGSGE